MLSCKDILKVLSEEKTEPLTFREKVSLKLHLMMCKHCANLAKHFQMIQDSIRRFFKLKSQSAKEEDIIKLEKKILDKIQK